MITKERKQEIMAAVEYEINRHISKQSLVSYVLDDMVSEESDWYWENCEGSYVVECGDFEE